MNKIMVVGEKDVFLIRILVKKLQDAGMPAEFVPWTVDSISAGWNGTGLVALYMDVQTRPSDEVLHFLSDRMVDGKTHMVAIGAENDLQYVRARVPENLILKTYVRPMDNEEFVKTAAELMNRASQGEFRKSILIVDDDPSYLSLVREWLKGSYKVAMANSGMQALRWLGMNHADLILLDYEMPVTSGPQVLEMLRSDEETRSIPVMFLTGKSDKESVMAVMSLKPDGYFLKSIERRELLARLGEYFALHL